MIRITADIDKKNRLVIIYYVIKALFKIKRINKIEIEPSPNKNWHLIIWTSYPYRLWEQYQLRKYIGDDLHRLSMDKLRKFGRNTLFYKKTNFEIKNGIIKLK